MCGRFIFNPFSNPELERLYYLSLEKYERETTYDVLETTLATGEIFPTNFICTIFGNKQSNNIGASWSQWGLKNLSRQENNLLINARAENIQKTKTFAPLFNNYRCIIPTTGFYEWKHKNGQAKVSEKYEFNVKLHEPLYMAGLYRAEKDGSGNMIAKTVIVTTAPNGSISDVHDRMPLIISKYSVRQWLFDDSHAIDFLTQPMPALTREKVS